VLHTKEELFQLEGPYSRHSRGGPCGRHPPCGVNGSLRACGLGVPITDSFEAARGSEAAYFTKTKRYLVGPHRGVSFADAFFAGRRAPPETRPPRYGERPGWPAEL